MSSSWSSVAQSWLRGDADLEELVIEAALEGQMTELLSFFEKHPPSIEYALPSPAVLETVFRPRPMTQEALESFACHCAYNLMATAHMDRAAHVIQNIHGSEALSGLLVEVLMSTLDASVQTALLEYLSKHQLIDDATAPVVERLMKLQMVYPVETYKVSLERFRASTEGQYAPNAFSRLEAALAILCPDRQGVSLMDDVRGISVRPESQTVWSQISKHQEKWNWKHPELQTTPPGSQRGQQMTASPLFSKVAVEWLRDLEPDTFDRIILEGEMLMHDLNKTTGESVWDDPDAKWRAALQHNLTHHMVEEAVNQLDDIPPSCIAPAVLSVWRNDRKVFQYNVRKSNFDVLSLCSTYSRQALETKLLTEGLWLQTKWENVEDWIGSLSRSGVLFGGSSAEESVQTMLQSEGFVCFLVDFCIQHMLPNALQSFLESNDAIRDQELMVSALRTAQECDWAQWLILSCLPGQSFAATVVNAKAILAKEGILVKTLSDLTQADSIHVMLSAVAHAPNPLSQTLALEPSAVQTDSPSQRDQFEIVDGALCPVKPVCCISDIAPQLQENFPETCRSLKSIALKEKQQGALTFAEFRAWRNQTFRTELGDKGFIDMVMTSGIKEIEELLRMSQSCSKQDSDPDQLESAQFWEEQQLKKVKDWTDRMCHKDVPEGISIGVVQHLLCGRPMAALQFFLAAKQSETSQFSDEEFRFLELLSRLVALWNFKDSSVVFSALIFAAACGIDTVKIKVDTTALQRLDATHSNSADVNALMEDLATEIAMEYDELFRNEGIGFASGRVLGLLENVILGSTSLQPLFSSGSSVESGSSGTLSQPTDLLLKWSLVHAFAQVHKLTPTKRLLEKLAQADDWILFLAEANFYAASLDEVMHIARAQFSDANLGHHVCFILEGNHSIQREASSTLSSLNPGPEVDPRSAQNAVNPRPVSQELFDLIVEAEQTGKPIQVLLMWAKQLKWRFLAVVASCYSAAAYLECLVAWLEIGTDTSDASKRASSSTAAVAIEEISREQTTQHLMSLVCQLCSKNQFDELLNGLTLFPVVPVQPIRHFLAAVKYYRTHMFNAGSQHVRAFEDALDKDIKKANAAKESMSASVSSTNIGALLTTYVDVELISRITQSAAIAALRAMHTAFEREKLLEALIRMEIEEELPWLSRLKTLRLMHKLLGCAVDSCIAWTDVCELPSIDVHHVLNKLLMESKWTEARAWAFENALPMDDITKAQAEALVEEWMAYAFEDDLNDVLWSDVNQIFVDHAYPCLKAARFFIQQAASISNRNVKFMLLEALQWIDGTRSRCLEPAHRLNDQLRRILCLMDCDKDVINQIVNKGSVLLGSRYEKCPAVQMCLRHVHETTPSYTTSELSRSDERSGPPSPSADRDPMKLLPRMDAPMTKDEQECLEILEGIVPKATEEQIQKTIKLLLDYGLIEAAESIQQSENLAAQIEFFLVDTALTIINKCGSNGWNGESAEKIVLAPILSFLKKKQFLLESTEPEPQDVLDAVVAACKESGGYPVCARAAITFKAAALLNMSCVELANYGPNKALELLLLKGECASDIARSFVSAFEFTPRATAKKLAEMYLNSLMGTRGISSINENEPVFHYNLSPTQNSSDLISNSGICSDWVEIGNALMQLLVERHSVLTADIEADILVQSFQCYDRVGYVEGLDVLLDLATSRVQGFAADENYEALIKVTVGICRFDGLSAALDVIVQNKKLDLLFQDTNSHNPSTVSTLRFAILSSIYKHSPKDSQTLNVTYRHFNMHVEVGQGIKDKAMELLDQYAAAGRPSRDQRLVSAMDLLIRAGAEFSCAQCSVSAASCGALVALVAQQICYGERKWVCLSDAEVRNLLPQLSDINSALIVARAYKFNTPQDWVLTLWQHMLHIAREYSSRSRASSLTRALHNLLQYSTGMMQEIVFSDEHLEQIIQMYVAFPSSESLRISQNILKRCIVQFLHSVADVQLRLNLCSMIPGDDAKPLIQECQDILDIEQKSNAQITTP